MSMSHLYFFVVQTDSINIAGKLSVIMPNMDNCTLLYYIINDTDQLRLLVQSEVFALEGGSSPESL